MLVLVYSLYNVNIEGMMIALKKIRQLYVDKNSMVGSKLKSSVEKDITREILNACKLINNASGTIGDI